MSIINPDYIEAIKKGVRLSPFPAHMSMTLEDLQVGSCKLELTVKPEHFQPFGVVHGGVIATLIDTATFWAVFLGLGRADDGLANVDLKLNYLAPVFGGKLIATGRLIRMGKRTAYSEAYVHDANGQLVAHGTSTLMVLPGKGIPSDIPRELES